MGDRAIEGFVMLFATFLFIWIGTHNPSPLPRFVFGNIGFMLLAIIILAVGLVAISVVTNSAE